MQLKDLLALPTFHDFQLLAGADGLQQEIGNVDILEYEWFTQNFNVFSENDFVLTSLFFTRDDASLIRKSIEKLLSRHTHDDHRAHVHDEAGGHEGFGDARPFALTFRIAAHEALREAVHVAVPILRLADDHADDDGHDELQDILLDHSTLNADEYRTETESLHDRIRE